MRYTITLASVAILAVTSQSAMAAASKEENIGVGTGAIVGSLAGGPVGFVIGAALGAKLGDTMHKKSERIEVLGDSLQDSRRSAEKLERGIDALTGELSQLQSQSLPELKSLMQAGIDMDLLFRTGESALTDATGGRLQQMAAILAGMPAVRIHLDGFADERGDAVYNRALSERRAEFVRAVFIAAGVQAQRISTSAHGESAAQSPDLDSYALERRVSVKLFIDKTSSVASNQS